MVKIFLETMKSLFYQNMEHNKEKDSHFYVVHFLQEPLEGIDYYVCVPYTWVILHRLKEKIVVVLYPNHEDPFVIRERAKKKERHSLDWAFCTAELNYQCDTYEDAELWISTNNNHRLSLLKNNSNKNGSTVPWDHELRSANQKYSSKFEDKSKRTKPYKIPKKGLPKSMDKESYNEAKKQLYLKQLNWKNEVAKSTAEEAVSRPVSSTESTTIRDEPSMESPQAKETAATDGAKSTEGSSHSTEQVNDEQDQSMLVIDVDAIIDVVNSKDQSQQEQPGETNGNQNQVSSDFVVAPTPPSPIKQAPQTNQHHDQRIRIKDVRTLTAPSNNQEPRVDSTSNTKQITSQLALTSDLCNQIENTRRNMIIAAQTSSNRIDLTQPLPKPLTRSSSANIQNPVHQEPPIFIANSMNCASAAGIMSSSQGIQHVTGMNTLPATDPRVVYSVANVAAPQNLTQLHQSPIFVYQIVQQNVSAPPEHMLMPGQGLLQIPTTQSLDPRLRGQYHPISQVPQYQSIRPSFNNNPTSVPSQFHQPQEIQHQGQRTVNHQDAQRPQAPVYIPILPKNDRQSPTLQGVDKTTPPPASSRIPNSGHQALLAVLEKCPLNEQELQAILSKLPKEQRNPGMTNILRNIAVLQAHCSQRAKISTGSSDQPSMEPSPVHQHVGRNPRPQVDQSNEANPTMKQVNFQDDLVRSATKQTIVADSRHQTNVCMPEPLSSPYSAASDSGIETDREAAFGYEMSVDEVANETEQTGYSSRDRTTAQNSLSELALQQQMVEHFANVCSQVSSTFKNTANVFDNLRNSLLETAKSYQTFFDNKRINASENSANHVSSSSNVAEEVPPVVEERQNSAPERRNSSNGNQSNGVSKAPKRTHQKTSNHLLSTRQFVLPPEYDRDDTKWTLKYRDHLPGHLELMPHSNIYVRYSELKRCEEVSNSCESLAQMMLHEVFNEKALGVCASMTEAVKINYNTDPDARPPLDNHGSLVLLNYVIQYGLQFGWSTDVAKILNTLDQEVKKIRSEYSVESGFCRLHLNEYLCK